MFRYSNTYSAALGILASGKVDVKTMVTHHFELRAAPDAFQTLRDDPTAIKIMIHPTSGAEKRSAASADDVSTKKLKSGE